MFSLIRNFIDTFRPVHTGEEGQDTFEYILVLGVLVRRIVDRFESMDISRLSKLKG